MPSLFAAAAGGELDQVRYFGRHRRWLHSVSALVAGDQLVLSVADDGPGLDHRPDKAQGWGVGLVNCRESCARSMATGNPFAWVPPGHGLTVTIRIPLNWSRNRYDTVENDCRG